MHGCRWGPGSHQGGLQPAGAVQPPHCGGMAAAAAAAWLRCSCGMAWRVRDAGISTSKRGRGSLGCCSGRRLSCSDQRAAQPVHQCSHQGDGLASRRLCAATAPHVAHWTVAFPVCLGTHLELFPGFSRPSATSVGALARLPGSSRAPAAGPGLHAAPRRPALLQPASKRQQGWCGPPARPTPHPPPPPPPAFRPQEG